VGSGSGAAGSAGGQHRTELKASLSVSLQL
jgi:hypothetical protein